MHACMHVCTPARPSRVNPPPSIITRPSSQQMANAITALDQEFSHQQSSACRPGPRSLSSCMYACSAHVQYPCTHASPPAIYCMQQLLQQTLHLLECTYIHHSFGSPMHSMPRHKPNYCNGGRSQGNRSAVHAANNHSLYFHCH